MMSLPDCGVDKIRMNDPALQSVGSLCEYVMCECVRLGVFVYVCVSEEKKKRMFILGLKENRIIHIRKVNF